MTVYVFLRCPACRHEWHEASILIGSWWAKDASPQVCASRVYCAKCQAPPPMEVVGAETQPSLLP